MVLHQSLRSQLIEIGVEAAVNFRLVAIVEEVGSNVQSVDQDQDVHYETDDRTEYCLKGGAPFEMHLNFVAKTVQLLKQASYSKLCHNLLFFKL